jgi:hypothetical protein
MEAGMRTGWVRLGVVAMAALVAPMLPLSPAGPTAHAADIIGSRVSTVAIAQHAAVHAGKRHAAPAARNGSSGTSSVTVSVVVRAAPATNPQLPKTGAVNSRLRAIALGGMLSIVVGSILVLLSFRRRRTVPRA